MSQLGDDLIRGLKEAIAYVRGEKPAARQTVVAVEVLKKHAKVEAQSR